MYIDANPGVTCGFVKEMVMDDLVVKPISVVSSITALNSYFNVKDVSSLQEKVVNLGMKEVFNSIVCILFYSFGTTNSS